MNKTVMKTKRIYHPWDKWECYKAGFYDRELPDGIDIDDAKIKYSVFLKNTQLFEENIKKVFQQWHYSCEHFLTNPNINRIAWIGQSSMCIYSGISSFYRGGFFLLSQREQTKANDTASKWLNYWVEKQNEKYKRKYKSLYEWLEE